MKVPKPRKLPSGSWFIHLRLGGRNIPVTESSEKACLKTAQLIKAEYLAGKKLLQNKEKSLTLSQAIDRYIQERENILSPSTIRGYRTIQRTRFKGYMNQNAAEINFYQMVNKEAGLCSPKTLINAWRFVRSVLAYQEIPTPAVPLPQLEHAERPFFTPEQIKRFVQAVNGETCALPALLALSSLRRSEIIALTWNHVHDDHIEVKGSAVLDKDGNLIHKKVNKNHASTRTVPILMPELKTLLDQNRQSSGLVCPGSMSTVYKQINRICRKNDLPLVGLHGLRHSFASLAYHLGVPEKIAMEIGGWSDFGTMRKIYTHIAKTDIKKYGTLMQTFFQGET